jgi:membrane-bound serine protease (ClpP class)
MMWFKRSGMSIVLSPPRLGVCWPLALVLFLFLEISQASRVTGLFIKGGVGPAMADYIARGIDEGQKNDLILIRLDTPGGLDISMRTIVQAILSSNVPVVVYVAPSGARAASAGTFILYASTIAAMAPGTHLGAASPVSLAGGFEDEVSGRKNTMNKKATNDALAYIRMLAQNRDRNVSFAEKAVLDAATLTATEAYKTKVIDLLAKDEMELFVQLDNRTVQQNGKAIKLILSNPHIEWIDPDWRTQFLLMITEPTIVYLLLLLGIYGIFFELVNPGFVAPGVIGAIAMLVALYGLQLMPISYAGLALIILGIAFIIAETFAPSFGMLGIGGTIAFITGSILLIDSDHGGYQIAWSAIAAMAAVNLLFFGVLLGMTVKSQKKPMQHGTQLLIGARGRTVNTISPEGQALINGEIWSVYSPVPISAQRPIKVVAVQGLHLQIEECKGE